MFIILVKFNVLFALIVNPECSNPLGMESGDIENFQISASSSNPKWIPSKARYNLDGGGCVHLSLGQKLKK